MLFLKKIIKYIDNEDHSIINVIKKIQPIDNARANMYHKNNIYSRIPKLLFKFTPETDVSIYYEIKNCVENFKGNLKWTLSFVDNQNPKRYYVLKPKIYDEITCVEGIRTEISNNNKRNDLTYESDIYGEEHYKRTCEKAILDIPLLAKHIKNHFRIQ